MKIALLGYGKMGKAIEQMALANGDEIVIKLDDFREEIDFKKADVAIDFSMPDAAFNNIRKAIENGIPIVSGTTGWLDKYDEVIALCERQKGSFIYASNFSLGVNLFFEVNKKVAKLMQNFNYEPSIKETHHTEKLDAPSGTAISLAHQILPFSLKKNWVLDKLEPENLTISAKRIKDVTGTHQVTYISEIDEIEIKHTAKNRLGFVQGALLAAAYIVDKKGIFTMRDVLGL